MTADADGASVETGSGALDGALGGVGVLLVVGGAVELAARTTSAAVLVAWRALATRRVIKPPAVAPTASPATIRGTNHERRVCFEAPPAAAASRAVAPRVLIETSTSIGSRSVAVWLCSLGAGAGNEPLEASAGDELRLARDDGAAGTRQRPLPNGATAAANA